LLLVADFETRGVKWQPRPHYEVPGDFSFAFLSSNFAPGSNSNKQLCAKSASGANHALHFRPGYGIVFALAVKLFCTASKYV
jgi:hypothetical protein